MKILITGVGGFIGGYLASIFLDRSYEVSGTTTRTLNECEHQRYRIFHNVKLGLAIPQSALTDYDMVIHASYDQTPGNEKLNYDGTLTWVQQFANAGAKRQVLLSSCSAHPDAPSDYGRLKYALESEFLAQGLDVVRLGLVVGDGGLFALIRKILCLPVTVALTGVTVQLISIELVALALLNLLRFDTFTRPLGLYYSKPLSMVELANHLQDEFYCQNSHAANVVVPIPVSLANTILIIASPFSPKIKRLATSLSALRFSTHLDFQSDLTTLGLGNYDSFVNLSNEDVVMKLKG